MERSTASKRTSGCDLLHTMVTSSATRIPLPFCANSATASISSIISESNIMHNMKLSGKELTKHPIQNCGRLCHTSHQLPSTCGLWTNISHRLGTVARCSTSQNPSDRLYGDHKDSRLDANDNTPDEDQLPGCHAAHQDGPRMRRNAAGAAVNDMLVNSLIEQESGGDRLRVMYALGPDGMFVQEDTRTLTTVFYRSVVLGFFVNAIKAAQTETKAKKHSSPSDAVRKMGMSQMSDSTRVLREAAKTTVRLSVFAASLIYVSQSIAAYRNVSSPWEYAISAALAGGVVRYGRSPKALATGVLVGGVLGSVCGSLVCSMLSSAGASQEQRTLNRIREQLAVEKQQQQKDLL